MNLDKNDRNELELNIAAVVSQTQALGPGVRAAIWVQGCPLHCPGCVAPNWIPFRPATILTPNEVLQKLDLQVIEGLTLSGGEPMEQASALSALVRMIKAKKDISLICFTGYHYERLLNHPPNDGVMDLLSLVDVLIDGPYIQSRNDSVGLRGSNNQRIIHLSSRLQAYELEKQRRHLEVRITDGELAFVGIPTPAMKTAMDRANERTAERMFSDERI